MVEIIVEVQDWHDYSSMKLKLPSNIELQLDKDHEYVVVDCEPYIKLPNFDDVFKLNKTLQYINDNNSAMTAELLSMLVDFSTEKDLFNETFLYRLVNDEFYFKEVNDTNNKKNSKVNTAKFLLKNQKIQPKSPIPYNPTTDIEWEFVWQAYSNMGFKIIDGKMYDYEGIFVVYW